MNNGRKNYNYLRFTMVLMICVTLAAASGAVLVSAHKDGGSLGDVPLTKTGVTVDGQKDAIYDSGLKVDVKYSMKGDDKPVAATGTASLLYSDGFLYVFFRVNDESVFDPDASLQTSGPWKTESCEVFINEKNSAAENDVVQYRIDCTGWPCIYTKTGVAKYGRTNVGNAFGYAAVKDGTGYCAEFKIPLKTATKGSELGIRFQINDVVDPEPKLNWATNYSALTGTGVDSWEVGGYAYVTLGGSEVPTEAPTEVPTEVPTEAPTEAPTEVPTDVPTEAPTEEPGGEATVEPATEAPEDSTEEPVAIGTETEEPSKEEATKKPEDPAGEEKKDKGCGNVIGGSVAVIVAAAASFVALKVRKKD